MALTYSIKIRIGDYREQQKLLNEARILKCDFSAVLISRWNILPLEEACRLPKALARKIVDETYRELDKGTTLSPERCSAILERCKCLNIPKPCGNGIDKATHARISAAKKAQKKQEQKRAGSVRCSDTSEKDFYAHGIRIAGSFGIRQ